MPLLCPECRAPLDGESRCPAGHAYDTVDGVLVLLAEPFASRLESFAEHLSRYRAEQAVRIEDRSVYRKLPRIDDPRYRHEWRQREIDLRLVQKTIGDRKNVSILEVGAWNGWLTHHLATAGHDVTAVDYFRDPTDGLGAIRYYDASWRPIQMDLLDLDVLGETFDLVIVNRCIQFFEDPIGLAWIAKRRVRPGGLLLITGLQLLRDPSDRIRALERTREAYRARGFDFLRPMRGYLTLRDARTLRKGGVRVRPMKPLWRANAKALVSRRAPRHAYGIWERPADERSR